MEGTVKRPEPSAEQLEFRFVSGHRVLDLLATLADRHRGGLERLRRPADLDRWLLLADLPIAKSASANDLHQARELRDAINRLVRTSMSGNAGDFKDIACLNEWAAHSPLAPQLTGNLELHWRAPDPVSGALALLAREAVELLSSPEQELIRECAAAPECSLLYLDRSRGRRRRWCEMERCGSRAKMAGYRQRKATPADTN